MPTCLKNVLSFTGLSVGTPVVKAHGLNISGFGKKPQWVALDANGFTFTSDTENVTITRTEAALSDSVNVYVEYWHTIEAVGPAPDGVAGLPQFVVEGGVGGVQQAIQSLGAGTVFATGPVVQFVNGNNVTFGIIGNTLTASIQTAGGTATGVGISAGTQVATTGAVLFQNSNNVTFGMSNGSVVTASASFSQTVQPVVSALSAGTTFASTGTIVFSNSNSVSFGLNGNTLTASFSRVPFAVGAGTQTGTSGTVAFSNSNGISFGMSGSTQVTASADYVRSISAGTVAATGNEIVFSNSNGVSFGANGATITGSINVTQSTGPSGIAAAGSTGTSGTIIFSNSNNISFGMDGNTITAAALAQSTGPSGIAVAFSTATSGTILFQNSNNVTFGMNGNTVTASALLSGVPGGIAAGTQTATSGTVVFSNSNGVSFGLSGSSRITASFSQTVQPAAVIAAGTQTATSGTVVFSNSNGVSFGLSNSSVVTASFSQTVQPAANIAAGTQTATSGTIVFSNSNGVSFGMSGSSRITASYSQSTGPAAISAGTTSASSGTIVFSNSNGVSFGLNGNTVTASASPPTISVLSQGAMFPDNDRWAGSVMSIQKVSIPVHIAATQAVMLVSLLDSFTSVNSQAITLSIGAYTLNSTVANLASSGTRLISYTTGAAQFSAFSGLQFRTIPVSMNLTPGDYLFAFAMQATGNSFNFNYGVQMTVYGQQFGNVPALDGDNDNFSTHYQNGIYTATFTSAMPTTIAQSDPNFARPGFPFGADAVLQPGWILYGT